MKLDEALIGVQVLYIETVPFIYYTESRAGFVDKMRAIFRQVLDARIEVVTSTITLTECLTKPLREKDAGLVSAYNAMLRSTRHVKLIPVDTTVAGRAADVRARYNLRTPDALHVASGLATGCDALLTNDRALRRVQELRVLVLDDLEIGQ